MDTNNPLFLVILQSFVTQVGGYLAVVGLLFLIFWVWGERRFAARRVQKRKRFTGKQLRHELLHTLITFVVSLASVGVLLVLHSMGRTSLVDVQAPGQTLALWIGGVIVFNDVWFYGWHRLLHTPWLFRHVHAVHHKSVDVNPFSSYSFHAFEGFILGAWIIPAAILLPIPMAALGVVQVIGLMNNVNSHLGYELLPAWWIRVPPFKWTASSTYHNLHHQRLNGNYALFFRWLDRAFGSEVVGYEAAFCDRSAPQQDPPGDAGV